MLNKRINKIRVVLIGFSMLPMPAYANSVETMVQEMVTELGKLKLFSIILLSVCLIAARLIPRGPSLRRKLLLGVVLLTFLISQGRSVLGAYKNSGLYQPRKNMTLSDLQILETRHNGRMFGGKKVLPLLVADYMPHGTVFLYDEKLYPKELLSWSGRDPDRTFVVGGYQATVDGSFKAACLRRPHVIDDGLYIATPLSNYQNEEQVFLMTDGMTDYLVPGSWRASPS
jgi:hypothetical protein